MDQIKIILEKNQALHYRQSTFWITLYVPVISVIISIAAIYISPNFVYILPVFLCLSINGVLRQSIALLVRERSEKFKQLQTLMGLNSNAYYFGWIISFFLLTIAVSFIYTIPFMAFQLNHVGNGGQLRISILIMAQVLYCMALSSLMLFLTTFFKNSSQASELLGLLNVILSFVAVVNFVPYPDLTLLGQLPTLFIPQTTFQMTLLSENWIWDGSRAQTLDITIYLVSSICQITFYLLAFVYLDQVFDGSKTPLFFCGCKNQAKTYVDLQEDNANEEAEPQQIYQAFLNIQQQQQKFEVKPLLQINNLWKKIDNYNILKSFSLDIYENEIFCLLGPNGAGKTTLMNILSGISQKTKGKISMLGYDIDLLQHRNQIGICMQKDILYSELNVYEHLRFYGRLRGVAEPELQFQINSLLAECQLTAEANFMTTQLSGGSKRKLCLAIALVGNSKLIFLDEPSSGMDVLTRQQMQLIIKSVRANRTIILTTHHMEEADELASRVDILIHGQLVTSGTPDFIKLNFGVGYHLTMEFNDVKQLLLERQRIQQELQKIDSLTPVIQSSPTALKSILPVTKINAFNQILVYLESNSKCKYSLQLNSLEDSYLAIDQQYGTQNVDLNAQSVFQQEPESDLLQQFKALSFRKLIVLCSSTDKLFKYLLPLPLIYFFIIIGSSSGGSFVYSYLLIKSLTSTLYITVQLDDKDTKIKAYMFSCGVHIHIYWLSNILTDVIYSLFEGVFTGILLWKYNIGHFGYHLYEVILLITIFGISLSCFINCLSQISKSAQRVSVSIPILCYFLFFNLFLLFMTFIVDPSAQFFVSMISMILMLVSPFMACHIGFAMSPILLNYYAYSYWSCLSFLIISGIGYLWITIKIDIKEFKQIEHDMSDTDAVIDAQELTKRQGPIETVHKLSFQVKNQEIFGLLGPNGAGKSTTLNMISRFDAPTTGQVRIREGKNNLGLVPQFCPFYPTLTIYQHLYIYGMLKGQKNLNASITKYLQALDMDAIKDRQVRYLSGGERRKVQIGIAMIGGSNRLLLDEPTTGLDPKSRRVVQQMLVQSIANNNATVVLTTHSLSEAQTICNRIGIMVNGYMIAQGTVNELRTALGNYVRFSVRYNEGKKEQVHQIICSQLTSFYQIQPVYEHRENHLSYQVPESQFRMSQLFQYLQNELKVTHQLILDFQIYQPSIDQIFAFFASQQINGPIINPGQENIFKYLNPGVVMRILMAIFCIYW